MIKGIKIHKSINEINILNGIDISINEGEIVSVVGKSGAGKTTLLQILGTLEKPTNGKVLFNDKDVFHGAKPPSSPTLVDIPLDFNTFFKW